MTSLYTYLISTLPTLQFGARPLFTPLEKSAGRERDSLTGFNFKEFIAYCQRYIPQADVEILSKVSISGEYPTEESHPVLRQWHPPTVLKQWEEFDTTLRNELVKVRASRRHVDAARYLRKDRFPELFITQAAISAQRNPSMLEAEKMLDQERWRALDELSFGHYFDLGVLVIYALKLLLLERWERIRLADKRKALEEVLSEG